ncbi:hypothetical protein C8F04DRAFT_1263361 [Mycena alexandri]|uniref:Uncharacterized protein n=1 Tax=Mycena alexandri TaxID=1745969 RepID=A0AAD6WZD5_9AGAR|nr:hypothetical protein C8F04DRAFT_1263361 [Mycena alexandri]
MPHRPPRSPRAPYVSDDGEPIEPWFLNTEGVMSTDPMQCFPPYGDRDSPPPGTPETFDRSHNRTYAAVSLRDIQSFLPLVFKAQFQRNEHNVWEQKEPLYFAVQGSTRVFNTLDDAGRRYYKFNDNNRTIFVADTYEEAKAHCARVAAE